MTGLTAQCPKASHAGDARLAALTDSCAALPSLPPPPSGPVPDAQALRRVSILFLDMVGSTTLSQQLDPEQLHQLLDGALQRCTAIVVQHQGRVLQYAGDNLLAVFGADGTMEVDAERALLVVAEAGIGKSRLLREFQAWLAAQSPPPCIFEGRAQPSSQARPYGLLCDMLAWALQINAHLGMASACARLEQAMAGLRMPDEDE